ncbi:MBL fold metallo-hydrolase [Pisciglobus halotolerans]|uniref:Ribonuclease BN, tRNA processing enzyme n=1 Tax=Pisciglobus halotolerans TaxID=745365 RepID=A0A1I3C8Z9_9LACT|nr:MBL fold metallo-hydrolase [Pisciglobus halotolerans]SFH70967.1 Ribonuclease BN, tRNA processing enzyme [Pisciglobus halotolerans]
MRLTVLGFWGGYPTRNGGTSSYLLESEDDHLLIDAGSASLISLEEVLDPLDLDAVLISHYHYDHIADLGVLQFTHQLKKSEKQRSSLLSIYGHQEDQENFARLTMENVSLGKAYHEEDHLEIGPFEVTFMRTLHPVPCFAFRIKEKKTGKILVFTADSGYLEGFIPFAEDADVLLADTNFYEGTGNRQVHMSADEVGKIAAEAKVKKLILTHLPQEGNVEELKHQAAALYKDGEILIAKKHLIVDI